MLFFLLVSVVWATTKCYGMSGTHVLMQFERWWWLFPYPFFPYLYLWIINYDIQHFRLHVFCLHSFFLLGIFFWTICLGSGKEISIELWRNNDFAHALTKREWEKCQTSTKWNNENFVEVITKAESVVVISWIFKNCIDVCDLLLRDNLLFIHNLSSKNNQLFF